MAERPEVVGVLLIPGFALMSYACVEQMVMALALAVLLLDSYC